MAGDHTKPGQAGTCQLLIELLVAGIWEVFESAEKELCSCVCAQPSTHRFSPILSSLNMVIVWYFPFKRFPSSLSVSWTIAVMTPAGLVLDINVFIVSQMCLMLAVNFLFQD